MKKQHKEIEDLYEAAISEIGYHEDEAYSLAKSALQKAKKLTKTDKDKDYYLVMIYGLLIDLAALNDDNKSIYKYFKAYLSVPVFQKYSMKPFVFMLKALSISKEIYKEMGLESAKKIMNDFMKEVSNPKTASLWDDELKSAMMVEIIRFLLAAGQIKSAYNITKESGKEQTFKGLLQQEVNYLDILLMRIAKSDDKDYAIHPIDEKKIEEYPKFAYKFKINSALVKELYKPSFLERIFK